MEDHHHHHHHHHRLLCIWDELLCTYSSFSIGYAGMMMMTTASDQSLLYLVRCRCYDRAVHVYLELKRLNIAGLYSSFSYSTQKKKLLRLYVSHFIFKKCLFSFDLNVVNSPALEDYYVSSRRRIWFSQIVCIHFFYSWRLFYPPLVIPNNQL